MLVVCCYAITMKDGHVLKLDKIGLMFSGFELKQILLKKITNLSTINYNDCFLLIFVCLKVIPPLEHLVYG